MSHNSKKLRWALTFISLLYTFDTAISKQLLRSDNNRRYCRHESINRCSLEEFIKRRRLASGGNLLTSVNGLASSAAAVLSTHHGGDDGHYRVKHDATIAQTKRKHISSCSNIHHRRTAIPAAFVSINNHSGASKISAKSQTKQPTTTTTTLHLKFKTFEEMIHHHHSTPLLIDFYAPWCGPCKLMKGEISSIRDQLDLLGPAVQVVQEQQEEEEEEDCSVEDVIALSSVCLEDGYIEEQLSKGGLSSSSLGKEDTTSLLKDLLPPPPTTTTKDTTQSTTKQPPQSTTTLPSGIPVYHVNTNKFPQVGAKNHIAGLPTLVLFYEGEELWRNEGLMKGEEIVSVLSELQEGGWKRNKREESVVEVCREEEESSSIVDETKKEEQVNAVVIAAAGEVDKKKKKRKGRRLGG